MKTPPASHSGEEDVNKTTNLIRRSLLGIPAQKGNWLGRVRNIAGRVSSGLGFVVLSLHLWIPLSPMPAGCLCPWRVLPREPTHTLPAHHSQTPRPTQSTSVSCSRRCPQQSTACREACDKQMRGTLTQRLEKPITFPLADHRVNQLSQNKYFMSEALSRISSKGERT